MSLIELYDRLSGLLSLFTLVFYMHLCLTNALLAPDEPFGKVHHNSRIESWLGCIKGASRVVLYTKKLHFVSRNWRVVN